MFPMVIYVRIIWPLIRTDVIYFKALLVMFLLLPCYRFDYENPDLCQQFNKTFNVVNLFNMVVLGIFINFMFDCYLSSKINETN